VTKYIVVWDEAGGVEGPRSTSHYGEVECGDTDKEIYDALKEYGLHDGDIKHAVIYKVGKSFHGMTVIPEPEEEEVVNVGWPALPAASVVRQSYDSIAVGPSTAQEEIG